MAGDVHHLTVPAGHAPAAWLHAAHELWAAASTDAIAEAAKHLLGTLVPAATLQQRARKETAGVDESAAYRRWIPFTERKVLVVTASPAHHEDQSVLDSAIALIDARLQAFNKQIALRDSVEQLGRAERLQRALYAIASQASAVDGSLAEMFQALHAIVGTLTYAENFFIALYDAHQGTVRFPYFADTVDADVTFATPPQTDAPALGEKVWRLDDIAYGPTWYVIHEAKPLMGSLDAMRRQVGGRFISSGTPCEDWLGIPLLRDGKPAGCVVVQSYDAAHHYNEQDKTLLTYVAQHIQTALEQRLAHVELEHRVAERTEALREANQVLQQQVVERQRGERLQAALFRIAELASTTDRIDNFYAAVHRVVGGLLYARNFYIALLSEDGTQLTFPYSVDEVDVERPPRLLTNGLTEYVLRNGTALLANAPEIARLRASGQVSAQGQDSVCWLGVPLVCTDHTAGAIAVQSYSPEHHYTLRDQELLTFVSYHIANALERVQAADSLRHAYSHLEHRVGERTRALALANRDLRAQIAERERIEARLKYETLHDSLTGLPNRTLLMQRLERALERYRADHANGFAVLFMDLDRFKVINDSVGHLVGDDLLFQAGNRIRACLKSEDVVARLGGDEFGVLLEGVVDTERACGIADRIINDLNAPFRLASKELFTSTSVGITLASPHYKHPDELLRDADSAMYRAKAEGRHRYALFNEGLRQDAVSLLEVENDLRRGLTRDEFVPYYQPVVDITSGKIVGYEALMRWRHPQRGVLLPGEFLGVAEDTGTSETIDWKIFTQACRDANALAGSNGAFVAINLSARHFTNAQLDQQLLGLLAEYNVPPTHLRVEVTERALLENTPAVKRTLQIFRHAGIGIALDDFGTGYSSLSYLHQYPLQTLKIDQSFVASMTEDTEGNSRAVIRAILAMAETLSMLAIAEGVETATQRDQLRQMGCRYVQGFLFSKAKPVDAWIGVASPAFAV